MELWSNCVPFLSTFLHSFYLFAFKDFFIYVSIIMSGISTTLDLKAFQSLLKGLVQIVYYHNPLLSSSNDITREDLVAKVYANSELDVNDKKNEIEIFENVRN